jgi:hypothetical protein
MFGEKRQRKQRKQKRREQRKIKGQTKEYDRDVQYRRRQININ